MTDGRGVRTQESVAPAPDGAVGVVATFRAPQFRGRIKGGQGQSRVAERLTWLQQCALLNLLFQPVGILLVVSGSSVCVGMATAFDGGR